MNKKVSRVRTKQLSRGRGGVLLSYEIHLDLRLLLLLAGGLALLLTPTLGLLNISSPSELSAVYDFREVSLIWLSSNA